MDYQCITPAFVEIALVYRLYFGKEFSSTFINTNNFEFPIDVVRYHLGKYQDYLVTKEDVAEGMVDAFFSDDLYYLHPAPNDLLNVSFKQML
ncbi:hypothetical protein C0995_015177 [Termitomyces sp. Mi166|nr:hypothetical protein C0995_015177 [Termitomyces sp. Mi166\